MTPSLEEMSSAFKVPTLALRPTVNVGNNNGNSSAASSSTYASSNSYEDEDCRKFGEEAMRRLERARMTACRFNPTRFPRVLGSGQYGVVFQVDDDRVVKHSSLIHRTMHSRCTPDALTSLQQRLRDGWNEPAAEQRFSQIVGAAFPDHVYRVYGARHCKEEGLPVAEIEIDRLQGQTLMSAFRRLSSTELSNVFVQLLYVTAYACFAGAIHNDLHFGNVMLVEHGGRDLMLGAVGGVLPALTLTGVTHRAVLIDYGMAQFTEGAFVPTDTSFVVQQFFMGSVPANMSAAVSRFAAAVPFVLLGDHILENGRAISRDAWAPYGAAIRGIVEAVIDAEGHVDYNGPRTPFTNSNNNNNVKGKTNRKNSHATIHINNNYNTNNHWGAGRTRRKRQMQRRRVSASRRRHVTRK